MSIIDREPDDELDSAARTFAETLYEHGFEEDQALDMSWALIHLPQWMRENGDDEW